MRRLALRSEGLRGRLDDGRVVKICGLRESEHAVAAARSGADFIGFIFAPARRQVTPIIARDCIEAARATARGREIFAIGVFVDADPAEVNAVVAMAGLDAVQLHGAEAPETLGTLAVPAIKALRPRPGETLDDVLAAVARYQQASMPPVAYLIDGFSPGGMGGTGARADWELAAALSAERRILLGGGLDPINVGEAISSARPLGVDVSSGVEIDGRKDPAKIAAFLTAARLAFTRQAPRRASSPAR
jgi:phosphoribosylanthranilate isomerase